MFDGDSTKSAVVLRVNMRCTPCAAVSQTSNGCGHTINKERNQRISSIGWVIHRAGHVNPQYDFRFDRISIKHHLTGKARLISNSTKSQ